MSRQKCRSREVGQEAADVVQVRDAGGLVHGACQKDDQKGPGLGCILG